MDRDGGFAPLKDCRGRECVVAATPKMGKFKSTLISKTKRALKKFYRGAFIAPRSGPISCTSEDRGRTPAGTEKRERAPPMLAKRIIVAAFAALAVGLLPLALPGERELFVDIEPAPQALAAN